ncbi:MAG: amino acid ABC transporter ATP-binding protein [Candidatus Bathyarchaeota archaeon]|nr:MAG: amino acid ABC transporter ATP-binding protein [Candidatus Bathyarchaeota archaeon]
MADTVLECRNLWKIYGKITAVKDVSLEVKEGDIKLVFGPSGSGKSTLARCLAMLTTPTKGEVILTGENLTRSGVDLNKARARIGFVFQHIWLFHHLTALGNVELGLRQVLKLPKEEARERALQALREVKMEGWAEHYPAQMSGGQQQRVGIARALAMNPEIIILDEPTSSLDPELTGEVVDTLRDLAQKGTTMLVISHEMTFAREVADEMIFIDEGAIIERGPPELFFTNPTSERARRFMARLIKRTRRE